MPDIVVGQELPGPPAGVIVVVIVPCEQVHIPSPSSRLGLLHSREELGAGASFVDEDGNPVAGTEVSLAVPVDVPEAGGLQS